MSNTTILAESKRENLVALVRKWGDVNTDGLLEETCQSFSVPSIEGFIGYRKENSHAVVFGDPVCSPENKPLLAKAFHEQCSLKNLGVVYTIASEEFAHWAFQNLEATTIEFGENFILDPCKNPINSQGSHAVLLRKKVKQALNGGAVVCEYREHDAEIEQKITDLATAWVKKRKGFQIYLAHVTLFNDRKGKRWFYAEQNGELIGLVVLNEIQARNGWLLNNVMLAANAPRGLSEFLIISVMQTLENENCHYLLVGPVPAKQLGKIKGINKVVELMARGVFQCAKFVFHLDGYEAYWTKFDPEIKGSYLVFPKKDLGYFSVKALLSAYNVSSV